ncbi:nucleolar complex protein 4 homolog isoform X1 [Lepus europaeus]|uniref:nucleolar complex protein 4 homolog isoform X1 n=1 Tax=Lepus europaeus TaxID=9983 RepID=UPI002B47242B|nr:nucleolar complex protein 4 homolog isoform X1 [Lepus europaeus]XP_062038421.1 nucleolar complex protein 4 homolog isoform X1 [Lepus europaeus]XP_062041514.1 nucleolar complex protein 4 homolog isoform X1 [Lepus europaeus]XP_062041515.1 nucleolar complex protein 4 homolog isoform X1 [Lepus europaeus]
MARDPGPAGARRALGRLVEAVLASRGEANGVFDILAVLQAQDGEEVQEAVRACSRLFGALLERGELFVGQLPPEDVVLAGSQGATRKYKVWMRHRYQSCCNRLLELLAHHSFQVKELALETLMKFVQLEGAHPLEKPKWEDNYLFPRELFKSVVRGLLSPEDDSSLLLSHFREYLEYDDIRYHTMQAATDTVARVTDQHLEVSPTFWNNTFSLLSAVSLPPREPDVCNFYVKRAAEPSDKWKVAHLKEHRKAFQAMWLGFLKHKLPLGLYKKVLVIMHDSILPHLAQPTLMIDFLTSAYDVGGAVSLLALNGLFILIHKHNLEYPDFYRKLYGLLEPSIFHVKYRARFFHLVDLFLSSSHLPAYLVAAFAKRLSHLALTAPPEALLMVLPFICNLLRRHPACRVLVHRPSGPELDADPYDPTEADPAKSRALESSLWELQTLQQHYHPEVSRAASAINQALSVPEVSIAPLLELTAYEIFERDLKKKRPEPVPLEFIPPQGLLGRRDSLCTQLFTLS